MGLAALGHSVHFLEDSDDYPSCYDPVRGVTDRDPAYGLAYAADVFRWIGLPDCWAFHDAHAGRWHGPRADDMQRHCADADALLNLSAVNPLRPWVARIPVRVLVDTDPVFTQVRHLTVPAAAALAHSHTAFFTFGENFGQPGCSIPDDGLPWHPTRQPIVLDAWPVAPPPSGGRYSTVMQWDSYPGCDYGGRHFGMKSESFPSFVTLPARVGPVLELALGGLTAPHDELAAQGWSIRNPLEVSRDPWTCRSTCGNRAASSASPNTATLERKRLVQRAQRGLPGERPAGDCAGDRVLALALVRRWCGPVRGCRRGLRRDCRGRRPTRRHSRAAREVAAAWFAADRVLVPLLDRAFATPPRRAAGLA